MICEIHLKNSFAYDAADIDFYKGKIQYHDEYVCDNGLVNPIGIYGTNGSGKSSLFMSLLFLWLNLVGEKTGVGLIPNFMHNVGSPSVSLSLLLGGKKYTYSAENGNDLIEILYCGDQELFARRGVRYSIYGIESQEEIAPTYYLLRKIGIETYASGDPRSEIKRVYEFFANMCFVNHEGTIYSRNTMQRDINSLVMEHNNAILAFQEKYSSKFPRYSVIQTQDDVGKIQYRYQYETTDHQVLTYPLFLISSGVKKQYEVLSSLLSLPKGSTIVIDEIGNSLHTLVLRDFINEAAAQGYQLIFSSHDTNILENLRPDQLFFCSWKDGVSKIKRLSVMYPAIREVNNIESMYLKGVFNEKINE